MGVVVYESDIKFSKKEKNEPQHLHCIFHNRLLVKWQHLKGHSGEIQTNHLIKVAPGMKVMRKMIMLMMITMKQFLIGSVSWIIMKLNL